MRISEKYPVLSKKEIESILDAKPQYRDALFGRGYLLTDDSNLDIEAYPFYGLWNCTSIGPLCLYVHPYETSFIYESESVTFILVGHAYNPFTMQHDENELLKDCAKAYPDGRLFETINEWTGAFFLCAIEDSKIIALTDACSMKMCHYSVSKGHLYISSHVQMIADLLGFSLSKYAKKIRTKKVYNIGLRWLPGLTSSYDEITRIGPNLVFDYAHGEASVKRFYPDTAHAEYQSEADFEWCVEEIYRIIRNNLVLCKKKWDRAAISLTGGMDSGATFACTAGFTDQFEIFSFDCKEQERLDSAAAKEICKKTGNKHVQYHIPDSNEEIVDFDDLKHIVDHNTAYFKNLAEEEIRKIIYLRDLNDFDVELKSDVAEIGRAFYGRKYGMDMPEVLNERECAVLQTKFFFMPWLLKQAEKAYIRFLTNTEITKPPYNYEHSDMLYWEFRIGAAAAVTTLSMGMAQNMTFPYNNRKLFELFFAFPHDMRAEDYPQSQIMKKKMPKMVSEDVTVEDKYFGKLRITLEKTFFKYKTAFYKSKI